MRARRLARLAGRLVAVAAFGVAVTIGGVAAATTDSEPPPDENANVAVDPSATTDEHSWD